MAKTWTETKAGSETRFASQKRMLSIWWVVKGVIYWELLPEKAKINAARKQLNKLKTEVINKGLFSAKYIFSMTNSKYYQRKSSQVWLEVATSPTVFARPCAVWLPLIPLIEQWHGYKKFENGDELNWCLQDFFDYKLEEFYSSGICNLPRRSAWLYFICSSAHRIILKKFTVLDQWFLNLIISRS